jgi:hypothetical protein
MKSLEYPRWVIKYSKYSPVVFPARNPRLRSLRASAKKNKASQTNLPYVEALVNRGATGREWLMKWELEALTMMHKHATNHPTKG